MKLKFKEIYITFDIFKNKMIETKLLSTLTDEDENLYNLMFANFGENFLRWNNYNPKVAYHYKVNRDRYLRDKSIYDKKLDELYSQVENQDISYRDASSTSSETDYLTNSVKQKRELFDKGMEQINSFIEMNNPDEKFISRMSIINGMGDGTTREIIIPDILQGIFGDRTPTTTQATKAETLISKFAEVKDDELDLFVIDKATGNKYTLSISKDGITSDNDVVAPGKIISDIHQSLTNPASYEGYVVDPINGVIKESNGIAQHNFENIFVDENVETSSLTINNSEAKKVVEIDEAPTEEDKTQLHLPTTEYVKELIGGGGTINDKQISLTASFGTDNIDPKTLRDFLDWLALRLNGGVNKTNKINFYFKDNGELEIRNDSTPIMIIENGKVNFLNQGVELIGDSNNPLSPLNTSQIRTLVNQLIASANLTEDKVNYINSTILVNTDANTNQYITYTPLGVNYFDRAGDTSEFITCGPDNFVASDTPSNMLGFELLFGGEFFNNQLGVSGQSNAWSEYLTIPTIALNKSVDYQVVHNIKGKKSNGEFFVKTKIELDMRYVLVNVDDKYQLEFGEFVNYSLITYNENGTINKTQTGTHYLNDSDYTYDKQPLRLELGGTGYTTIGSGSVDLTDYYTKNETDLITTFKSGEKVSEVDYPTINGTGIELTIESFKNLGIGSGYDTNTFTFSQGDLDGLPFSYQILFKDTSTNKIKIFDLNSIWLVESGAISGLLEKGVNFDLFGGELNINTKFLEKGITLTANTPNLVINDIMVFGVYKNK